MATRSARKSRQYRVTRVCPANVDRTEVFSVPGLTLNVAQVRTVVERGDELFCDVCHDSHEHCPDLKEALGRS